MPLDERIENRVPMVVRALVGIEEQLVTERVLPKRFWQLVPSLAESESPPRVVNCQGLHFYLGLKFLVGSIKWENALGIRPANLIIAMSSRFRQRPSRLT
jgi:hypothetical protein